MTNEIEGPSQDWGSIAAGHDIWCKLVIYSVQFLFPKLDKEKTAAL